MKREYLSSLAIAKAVIPVGIATLGLTQKRTPNRVKKGAIDVPPFLRGRRGDRGFRVWVGKFCLLNPSSLGAAVLTLQALVLFTSPFGQLTSTNNWIFL